MRSRWTRADAPLTLDRPALTTLVRACFPGSTVRESVAARLARITDRYAWADFLARADAGEAVVADARRAIERITADAERRSASRSPPSSALSPRSG
jgi:hypothetical protein